MTIKFHSEARKEFLKTAEYYEEQVIGLGDEFIEEVEKVLEIIQTLVQKLPNLKDGF